MYVKISQQIYDETLATGDPWEALVTFQQLLVLANRNGVVDIAPVAISRRTTIPIEVILKGLQVLIQPVPGGRTPEFEGRRIVPLCDHRQWGWRILNYTKYRASPGDR